MSAEQTPNRRQATRFLTDLDLVISDLSDNVIEPTAAIQALLTLASTTMVVLNFPKPAAVGYFTHIFEGAVEAVSEDMIEHPPEPAGG